MPAMAVGDPLLALAFSALGTHIGTTRPDVFAMMNGADPRVTFTRVLATTSAMAALVLPSMTANIVSLTPLRTQLANVNATTSGAAHDAWITLDLVPKPETTAATNAATAALELVQTTALSASTTPISTKRDTAYVMNTGAEKAAKTTTTVTFTPTLTRTTLITVTQMKETTGPSTMMDLNTITITTKSISQYLKADQFIPMITITVTSITLTPTTDSMVTSMTDIWDTATTMVAIWENVIQHVTVTVTDLGPLIVALVDIMLTGMMTNPATVDVMMVTTATTVPTATLPSTITTKAIVMILVTATVTDPNHVIVRPVENTLIWIIGDTASVTTITLDTAAATTTTTLMTTSTTTITDITDTVTTTATALATAQRNTIATHVSTTHTWTHGDTVAVTTVSTEITVTLPMMDTTDMDIPMNVAYINTMTNLDTVAATSTGKATTVTSTSTTLMTNTAAHVTQSALAAPEATQLNVRPATTMPTGTPQADVSVTSTGLVTIV